MYRKRTQSIQHKYSTTRDQTGNLHPYQMLYKCYALESHFTNECPKSKDFKICSECSAQGHVWHRCQESLKKCLNCGENHSALAIKWAKRKEIIKEKRHQVKESQI